MLNTAAFATKHQLFILSTEVWTEPNLENNTPSSNIWAQTIGIHFCSSPKKYKIQVYNLAKRFSYFLNANIYMQMILAKQLSTYTI